MQYLKFFSLLILFVITFFVGLLLMTNGHFSKNTLLCVLLIIFSILLPFTFIKLVMSWLYPGYNVKKLKEISIPIIIILSITYIIGRWAVGMMYIYEVIMVTLSCILSILTFAPKTHLSNSN